MCISSVPPVKVIAYTGGDVILPCNYSIHDGSDILVVEWSKKDPQSKVIFLYRDGCETFEMKHEDFEYRTNLLMKELKTGNISLRLSNIQLSDAGTYKCLRIWKTGVREHTEVELDVVSVSKPNVSVVPSEDAGLTLECEARGCQQVPEITFLDDIGTNLSAEEPKRSHGDRGCYNVKQRITLQSATSRVTCRVHHPQFNHTRETEILIHAACMKDDFKILCIVGAILVLLLICVAVYFWRRPCESGICSERQTSGNQFCMKRNCADKLECSEIETLKKEVNRLKKELHESNETISQLKETLKASPSPIVCQITQPTIGCSPSSFSLDVSRTINIDASTSTSDIPKSVRFVVNKTSLPFVLQNTDPVPQLQEQNINQAPKQQFPKKLRRHSTSAPLQDEDAVTTSSLDSGSRKKLGHVGRSMSASSALPDQVHNKVQRRHSFGHTLPFTTNNPFGVLANLQEEADPLLKQS